MSVTPKEEQANSDFDQLKSRLKATWMTGDYDVFARLHGEGRRAFLPAARHQAGYTAARCRLRRRATRVDCGKGRGKGYRL